MIFRFFSRNIPTRRNPLCGNYSFFIMACTLSLLGSFSLYTRPRSHCVIVMMTKSNDYDRHSFAKNLSMASFSLCLDFEPFGDVLVFSTVMCSHSVSVNESNEAKKVETVVNSFSKRRSIRNLTSHTSTYRENRRDLYL